MHFSLLPRVPQKVLGLLQNQLQQIYPLERSCLGWPREALDKGTEHNILYLLVSVRVVSNDRLSKIDLICLCMFLFISDVPVPHAPCVGIYLPTLGETWPHLRRNGFGKYYRFLKHLGFLAKKKTSLKK